MPNKELRTLEVGEKLGSWTVVEPRCDKPSHIKGRQIYCLLKCKCGKNKKVNKSSAIRGSSPNCLNCRKTKKTHGESHTLIHNLWLGVKQRVKHTKGWADRGINMQESWFNDYVSFRDYIAVELGERPTGNSLDRIDNDGDYCEGNIRWASQLTQCNNKRNTREYPFYGEFMNVRDISNHCEIPYKTIIRRLEHGWDIYRATSQPLRVSTK